MERDGLGPTRHVYSDAMVDTLGRIGRVRAPCTSAGGNGVAAVPARAAPRINLGAGAKAGSAFGWGRVAHHRVPSPGPAQNTRAWGHLEPWAAKGCQFFNRLLLFEAGSRGREQ